MDYIEIGMNFGYLKEKLGEPDEVNTNDNRYIATWNVENLSITVELKDKTAVKSIGYEDKCVDKHTSYYSYGSWMQGYTFYLGKSTFKTSENDVNFTIEAGMQIEIDYHQKVYGLRGEGFKEYTFWGAADGLSYSDFEGIDLPITIDKLPKELQQKVVKDAASSVITTFGISEGF
jgi:hypothetical protein